MRVRWWPQAATRRAASTRLRCLYVMDKLRSWGVDAALYSPHEAAPDVLVLAKRYDSSSIASATRCRSTDGTRLVLDLCDNHFYNTVDDPKWRERADALRAAAQSVDLVVASTAALKEAIEAECPNTAPVIVIGDPVEPPSFSRRALPWRHPVAELELLGLKHRMRQDGIVPGRRLVWFGSHGSPNVTETGMLNLMMIKEQLQRAAKIRPLSLTIISNNRAKYRLLRRELSLPVYYLPWHEATFSRAMRLHDIALIPVPENPFAHCKTNNRVATSLMHGLTVLADPIPSYLELRDYIYLGDWDASLDRALDMTQPSRRAQIAAGLRFIRHNFALGRVAAQWRTMFHELVGSSVARI